LGDVGEFVAHQVLAGRRVRGRLVRANGDVIVDGEGSGVELVTRCISGGTAMDAGVVE